MGTEIDPSNMLTEFEALIRSSEYLFNQQDKDLGSIYASTKGVVSCHRLSLL